MKPDELIEAYVTEVAVRLPRKQRNDVAFELRALLREDLHAKADAAGREADAAMALEIVRSFGRPADVAERYRPTLVIIDPADGHAFARATIIGLAIIWVAGLAKHLQGPIPSGWDVLTPLGAWWGGTVIPSLWWPGVLVAWYAAAAWARRRRSPVAAWTPRPADRLGGGRPALALGLAGILCGVAILLEPRWVLDFFFRGGAAPAAYDALTYTETFRQRQAPMLLLLILLNVPLLFAALVAGRWSAFLRCVETGLALVMCAALAWTVLDGPVLLAPGGDRAAKGVLVLIIVFTLVVLGLRLRRVVTPAPSPQAGVGGRAS